MGSSPRSSVGTPPRTLQRPLFLPTTNNRTHPTIAGMAPLREIRHLRWSVPCPRNQRHTRQNDPSDNGARQRSRNAQPSPEAPPVLWLTTLGRPFPHNPGASPATMYHPPKKRKGCQGTSLAPDTPQQHTVSTVQSFFAPTDGDSAGFPSPVTSPLVTGKEAAANELGSGRP